MGNLFTQKRYEIFEKFRKTLEQFKTPGKVENTGKNWKTVEKMKKKLEKNEKPC